MPTKKNKNQYAFILQPSIKIVKKIIKQILTSPEKEKKRRKKQKK